MKIKIILILLSLVIARGFNFNPLLVKNTINEIVEPVITGVGTAILVHNSINKKNDDICNKHEDCPNFQKCCELGNYKFCCEPNNYIQMKYNHFAIPHTSE